ncbi:hypothetical protein KVM50_00320 [Helicobacter pylori]|nr:hypothetical protein KVM50_00320 [Helicobacter pylori]
MIDVNGLLKELDDALDKVVAKKEPESFLKPIVSLIEDYQKSVRQVQAQFTDAPQFNETTTYPKFLSCGLLHVRGKNGANMEFLLPKVYPFPPKSLYIEHEKDGQFLREMLMRLLSSTPLVQLEVILVDALSLGGIFNLARRLLDKNNDFIYQQRILTESKEIEEALKHLYEYLKVNLQEKLAGYKDFAHYNEEATDRLPLKALFLSGVDALSQNALYYLEKIMRFGSKNGVLSFVNLESEKNNKSAEDLKKHAEFFRDTTSFERFKYLNVEVINDQGIKSQHMKDFADKIKAYYKQKKEVNKIYNGETPLKMPNTLKANEMRLHLGKKVDYEQKDLIVEFESNESHLLVVSQDLSTRIALMKLLFQNIKSANKELVFCNKEKRLIRFFDAPKEYGITPVENILSVLDTAMNPNSTLVIDNLNEAKELHDKVGAEKLKSFLEKAIDNEQYCVIFAHDYRQIKNNYHLDKLRELLNNHFKQCLAFKCNGENLNALKSNLPSPSELNALLIELSKDSHTEFRPFSL